LKYFVVHSRFTYLFDQIYSRYQIETVALKSQGGTTIVTGENMRIIADYTYEVFK